MDDCNKSTDWDCGHDGKKAARWWKRQSIGIKALIIIGCVVLGLGAAVGLFTLFGHIVMWLWNWIMPYLFNLPTINFWMAWGIVALSMILFGRASSGSSDSSSSKKRKKKIKESIQSMPTGEAEAQLDKETQTT